MSEVIVSEVTLSDEISKFFIPTADALVSWAPGFVEHAQYAAQCAVTLMGMG
ncbi:hypothetical protein [Pandoraea sputorum]|uniref:Uncharacterized protein n=1 Tax=Pandoraea sputorum TaxID=93222 RepID=A0A5E5BHW6_9BURK|nr:hypothetical protein [Pandoraea sputorum]VVE85439.1 hypothetical protein PSP31121_05254 [Pandoraea sputorum]